LPDTALPNAKDNESSTDVNSKDLASISWIASIALDGTAISFGMDSRCPANARPWREALSFSLGSRSNFTADLNKPLRLAQVRKLPIPLAAGKSGSSEESERKPSNSQLRNFAKAFSVSWKI
jgi:hypothetical protein